MASIVSLQSIENHPSSVAQMWFPSALSNLGFRFCCQWV
jgi:hypothetical protein